MPSGFLYNVKAVVDKASFESAKQELSKLEATSKKMMLGLTGLAAGMVGAATVAGNLAQQELKVSRAVGISSDAMSKWKVACNIAGASANGLFSALSSLETKMQHLKTGSIDMGLAKNLGVLGIGYGNFANMDSEQRMAAVFNQASAMSDQRLAATLVGDVLGEAGKEYYETLKMAGVSLDKALKDAKALNYVTEQNRKEAAIFTMEVRSIKEAGKSIMQLFGSELGKALTPTATKIKNYLITNKDKIQKGIQGISKTVGQVVESISGVIAKIAPVVEGLIDKFGGLDKVIIKLGVGFASLKLMQFAGSLKTILTSINLLKAGLGGIGKGLMGAGLYLLLDDLMVYFSGGDSLTGDILKFLDEVKQKFGFDDALKNMVASFQNLANVISGEKFQKALSNFIDFLSKAGGNMLQTAIEQLTALCELITAINEGDWKAASKAGATFAESGANLMTAAVSGGTVDQAKKERELQDKYLQGVKPNDSGTWIGQTPEYRKAIMTVVKEGYRINTLQTGGFLPKNVYESNKENIDKWASASIKDGIISPGGRVTSVSPDDWVFAVKDIGNLASAFIPQNTNNNSMTTVINQNFEINGARDIGEAVRVQAYNGASEAIRANVNQGTRYMQLMSGVR